ncbi:MAG: mitochondrial fission ELM1 family protein, partial [Pseudomonadota bacterium]
RPGDLTAADGPPVGPPWPDLVIACGGATAAPAAALKRWGVPRVVFLQKPPNHAAAFDLIAAPAHDGFDAPNAIATRGAPNRVTPAKLSAAAAQWRDAFAPHPRPWVALLVGGASKRHRFPPAAAAALGRAVAGFGGGSVFGTLSRRTGAESGAALRDALAETPGWIWDGAGDNPYFGLLGLCDAVIVTADSVSMLCEAATAGRPCFIADLPGGSPRFDRFHAGMRDAGYARPLTGGFALWTPPPLDDAGLVAEAIRARFNVPAQPPIV